jgi:uncharacterized protein with beta-barrel porin domain
VRTPAVALGLDGWLGGRVLAGAAVSAARPRFRSGDADIDSTGISGAAYAGVILPWDLEALAYVTLGRTAHVQTRRVRGEGYRGRYTSRSLGAGALLARPFALTGNASLRPFASYEITRLSSGAYSEGPGLYALDVGAQKTVLHRLQAGAELGLDLGPAAAGVMAFYSGQLGDLSGGSQVSFTGDPGRVTHRISGYALDRHSLGLGLSAKARLGDAAELAGGWSYLGGGRFREHGLHLTLGVRF